MPENRDGRIFRIPPECLEDAPKEQWNIDGLAARPHGVLERNGFGPVPEKLASRQPASAPWLLAYYCTLISILYVPLAATSTASPLLSHDLNTDGSAHC